MKVRSYLYTINFDRLLRLKIFSVTVYAANEHELLISRTHINVCLLFNIVSPVVFY